MLKEYTEVWNNFQFRQPIYLDGHFEANKFDLVKWVNCEPREVLNMETGEKEIMSRYCFSIGRLIWNPREPGFNFESIGLRYLEERVDGLEEFILNFCKEMEEEINGGFNDVFNRGDI